MATLSIEVKTKTTVWYKLVKMIAKLNSERLMRLFVGKPLIKMYVADKHNCTFALDNDFNIIEL